MCIDVRVRCECGDKVVQFHLRDNVMIPEVINRLYCPDCPGHETYDSKTMINDNGWIIEYDMDIACTMGAKKLGSLHTPLTPDIIFDEGYACWLEIYPGEKNDICQEKKEIQALLKKNQKAYLTAIQSWNIDRISRLKVAGWRRAQFT